MRELDLLAIEIVERGLSLVEVVDELRRKAVRMALAKFEGNQSQAARALSMDRATLRRLQP
ncbi:hypothetical protein BH09MYX1_BH09MYX1_03810 [soil metagenome]